MPCSEYLHDIKNKYTPSITTMKIQVLLMTIPKYPNAIVFLTQPPKILIIITRLTDYNKYHKVRLISAEVANDASIGSPIPATSLSVE